MSLWLWASGCGSDFTVDAAAVGVYLRDELASDADYEVAVGCDDFLDCELFEELR